MSGFDLLLQFDGYPNGTIETIEDYILLCQTGCSYTDTGSLQIKRILQQD